MKAAVTKKPKFPTVDVIDQEGATLDSETAKAKALEVFMGPYTGGSPKPPPIDKFYADKYMMGDWISIPKVEELTKMLDPKSSDLDEELF